MPLFEPKKSRNHRLTHLSDARILENVGVGLLIEQGKDKDKLGISQAPFRGTLQERLSILQSPLRYAHYVGKHVLSAHQAWLLGGMAAAERLVESDLTPVPDALSGMVTKNRKGSGCVKKAWGRGDEAKATALVKVFTGQMISYWFRNADKWQNPESIPVLEDSDITCWFRKADKQELLPEYMQRVGLEGAASVMLRTIDGTRRSAWDSITSDLPDFNSNKRPDENFHDFMERRHDEEVEDFIQIDRQWNWECDSNPIPFPNSSWDMRQSLSIEGQPFITYSFLLAKALEACGQRCVDWNTVPFPVRSMQQLIDESTILDRRPFDDLQERLLMLSCIDVGLLVTRERYHYLVTELYAGE